MHRRTVLKMGAGLALAGAAGYRVLPSWPSRTPGPVDALARELYTSLDTGQRAEACVPYDHPLRQYHNRGVWGGGSDVFFGFSRRQRGLLTDLMHASLSEDGRDRIPREYFARLPGVNAMRALICGDPSQGPYQVILTGAHINLRIGGRSREGAAFGGPQVYGDQRGNNEPGLPRNLYRDQFLIGQRLFTHLDAAQKQVAVIQEEPVQTSIELQGETGPFPGVPIAELAAADKALVQQLVDSILATYRPDDVAYARACLQANGGIERMSLSYYEHGSSGRIADAQVFRIEGPAAVFHFRGYPHVHAFINIAMSAAAPISSGESLGENPRWLERPDVKALFESAMRSETGAPLAYYPEDSIAGRLRPGTIRSGDIYALESWQEQAVVLEVHGSTLTDMMREQIPEPEWPASTMKMFTVATTEYAANDLTARIGQVDARRDGQMLRDLTVGYLKKHPFTTSA